jgi:hypothetical protein
MGFSYFSVASISISICVLWPFKSFARDTLIQQNTLSKIPLSTCDRPFHFVDKASAEFCQEQVVRLKNISHDDEFFSMGFIQNQRSIKNIMVQFNQDETPISEHLTQIKGQIFYSHRDHLFWGNFVNKTIGRILELKSVGSIEAFCKSIPIAVEQFALQFGFTKRNVATKYHDHCFRMRKDLRLDWFGNQLSMKDYIFVVAPTNYAFSGWTDSGNSTFIFIQPESTWGDLATAIIHEIAVGMDGKMFRGPMDDMLFYQMSSDFDEDNFAEFKELVGRSFVPAISYTFSAMRANRMMSAAIKEIAGQTPIVENESLEQEFRRIFAIMKTKFKYAQQSELLQSERLKNVAYLQALKYPDVDGAVEYIFKSKAKFPFGLQNDEIDFVTYITTPRIGLRTANTTGSNGPGCGYCGGSFKPEIEDSWNSVWNRLLNPLQPGSEYDR